MVKRVIGGVVTLVIGGTTVAVSQTDIAKNFSQNTGVSEQQAQQYVNNIKQSDLASFSDVGNELITDGNSILSQVQQTDCVNYKYQWEAPTLSCSDGKNQLQGIGNDEVALGNCYQALGTDLGSAAKPKMSECITDIDTVDSDYDQPVATALLDSNTITEVKNRNIYNKSLLQAALNAN